MSYMLTNNDLLIFYLLLWLRFLLCSMRIKISIFVQIWFGVGFATGCLFLFTNIFRRNSFLFAHCYTTKRCKIVNILVFIFFAHIEKLFYSSFFLIQVVEKRLAGWNLYRNICIPSLFSPFFESGFD